MNIFEKQIEISKQYIPAVEKALLNTYFTEYDQDFLNTEPGIEDKENHVFKRYNNSLRHVLPWLNRQIDLAGKKVLEIGCGTGSSTAALAHYVQHIEGYDIHSLAVQGARERLEIMGLNNVDLHVIDETTLIDHITTHAAGRYDIILLFAVLEHQTIEERYDTLKTCWELLTENGIMAVLDTPNILHYFDLHTSKLPFLHLLPNRLYARYAGNSPRSAFVESFSDQEKMSDSRLDLKIARWGRGASYHDFELAIGKDYGKYIVAEGFEPEILDWFVCTPEEEILRWYIQLKEFDIPLAFTRCVLNLILKKPSRQNSYPENRKPASPPPITYFNPDTESNSETLKQQLKEKDRLISEIYQSKTWRVGNLLATPYRKLSNFFKH